MTEKRQIPFFPYGTFFRSREGEFTRVIQDVLRRGAFILQKDLEEFEGALARYLKVRHAIGVGNATDGMLLALRAAGLQAGDEVVISSHTFVATASAIHFAGGVAVPVEAGPDHLIDPDAVEGAITSRTRFLMPTQLNGRTCDMDRLQAIADRNHLQIVEDAAQGLGSRFRQKFAGTFGIASAVSFYPAKILGCFGDGGVVVTNDDEVARKVRLMRDHGRDPDGKVVVWGLNSRLDNLQAAILNHQFQYYGETIARRRQIAQLYDSGLRGVKEVTLPPSPEEEGDHFDTYQNYEIEADRRDELRASLKEVGIGTLVQWGGVAVHQMKELGFHQRLPRTEKLFTRSLMLPMNTYLSDEDVQTITDAIRQFYRR